MPQSCCAAISRANGYQALALCLFFIGVRGEPGNDASVCVCVVCVCVRLCVLCVCVCVYVCVCCVCVCVCVTIASTSTMYLQPTFP